MAYSTDPDVTNALGSLGGRLPPWVVLATFRSIAHAELSAALARIYPDGIPTFTGVALDVVRFAEAKIAAAGVLEAIRVNLPDLGDAPTRLRETAFDSIEGGVVGFPAGSTTGTATTSTPAPRVSSLTQLSAFPDPYAPARLDPLDDVIFAGGPIRYQ